MKKILALMFFFLLLTSTIVFIPNVTSETYENDWGKLEVYPDVSNKLIRQEQLLNLTWKKPSTNVDVAFRFKNALTYKNIYIWKNISHDVIVPDYSYIIKSYTLVNISDFSLIAEPEFVMLGDIPSNYYAIGYLGDISWNTTVIIGFDSWNWLNPEHTNCSFEYEVWDQVGTHIEEIFYFDWLNINHKFNYQVYNNYHYYYVSNWCIQNTTYHFKLEYDVPINSNGKWDLLAKLHSDAIQFALQNNRYIIIDPWWDSNWNKCVSITIDCAFVDDGLVNVPVLIPINDAIGDICKSSGEDIRFTLDNVTLLNHEIEKWVDNEARLVWVNVTSVSSTEDTVLYMYFNNPNAEDGQNIEDVWDSNYVVVLHLVETGVNNRIDSTSYSNDAVRTGDVVSATGKIGLGNEFDGTIDYLTIPHVESLRLEDWTISFWLNPDNLGETVGIINKGRHEFDFRNYQVFHNDEAKYMGVYENDVGTDSSLVFTVPQSNDVWHYVTYIHKDLPATRNCKIWLYDNIKDDNNQAISPIQYITSDLKIGDYVAGGWQDLDGTLDEIRISNIVRSSSWIKFSYFSDTQEEGFLTWGSIQDKPAIEGSIPDILYTYPVNNSVDVCPCCPIFGVNVSNPDGTAMNIIFSSNLSGSWVDVLDFSSVYNGSYYGVICDFNKFTYTYYWSVNVSGTGVGIFNNSGILVFDTTDNIDCGTGETTDDVIGYAIIFGLFGGILGGIIFLHKKRG